MDSGRKPRKKPKTRKSKPRQKQKQSQTQKVIVNVGELRKVKQRTRKVARSKNKPPLNAFYGTPQTPLLINPYNNVYRDVIQPIRQQQQAFQHQTSQAIDEIRRSVAANLENPTPQVPTGSLERIASPPQSALESTAASPLPTPKPIVKPSPIVEPMATPPMQSPVNPGLGNLSPHILSPPPKIKSFDGTPSPMGASKEPPTAEPTPKKLIKSLVDAMESSSEPDPPLPKENLEKRTRKNTKKQQAVDAEITIPAKFKPAEKFHGQVLNYMFTVDKNGNTKAAKTIQWKKQKPQIMQDFGLKSTEEFKEFKTNYGKYVQTYQR